MDLCDMVTPDVYDMAGAITGKDGSIMPYICSPECNMVYLRTVYIEENCRGFGVGKYLLDNLNSLLLNLLNINYHTCILLPYPQTKEERAAEDNISESLPRLIKFYENAGYSKIDGSDYMYKKRDDGLAFLYE